MRQCGDGGIEIAKARLNLRERGLSGRLAHGVCCVISNGALRLVQSFCFFSKPGISERESARGAVRICRNGRVRFGFDGFDSARKTATRFFVPTGPLLTKSKLNQSDLGTRIEPL